MKKAKPPKKCEKTTKLLKPVCTTRDLIAHLIQFVNYVDEYLSLTKDDRTAKKQPLPDRSVLVAKCKQIQQLILLDYRN